MSRELIYVYTENLNNCFVNQGFKFSNNFEVEFDVKEGILKIFKVEDEVSSLIWGENITSINLLVGKNGSGKSTILDLIGSDKRNRNELLAESDSKRWFAVYSLKDDVFVIEGNSVSIIKNFNHFGSQRQDYAYIVQFERGYFKSIHYIQEFENEVNELIYLYDSDRIQESWYYSNKYFFGMDGQLGYKRNYLLDPNIGDIFKILNSVENNLDGAFNAKNVKVRINRRSLYRENEKINSYIKLLNLYNSNNKLVLVLNPDLSEFNLLSEKVIKNKWSPKERFIIEFLEESIFYRVKDVIEERYKEIIKSIKKIKFDMDKDNFNYRVDYLKLILEILYSKETLYFNNIKKKFNGYTDVINILIDTKDQFFLSEDLIAFDFYEYDKNPSIMKLVKFYDKTEIEQVREVYPLKIEFTNLSSGELQFIKHFSKINQAINIATLNSNTENVILLLDEPDRFFHPEWSRKYINTLVNLLNNISFDKSFKFQVILTTHSPFMISDIPKNYITCIDVIKEKENDMARRLVSKANFGLMSNFYDLIKNNFFIKYPIGDFARKIFDDLKQDIDSLHINNDKLKSINIRISLIDDPLIKMKLKEYLEKKLQDENLYVYEKLIIEKLELEKRQEEIEQKLKIIEEGHNND